MSFAVKTSGWDEDRRVDSMLGIGHTSLRKDLDMDLYHSSSVHSVWHVQRSHSVAGDKHRWNPHAHFYAGKCGKAVSPHFSHSYDATRKVLSDFSSMFQALWIYCTSESSASCAADAIELLKNCGI